MELKTNHPCIVLHEYLAHFCQFSWLRETWAAFILMTVRYTFLQAVYNETVNK